MDTEIETAISLLKSNGYAVFEAIPTIEQLSDHDLNLWRSKINAWGVDICHEQITCSKRIRAELDRRESL